MQTSQTAPFTLRYQTPNGPVAFSNLRRRDAIRLGIEADMKSTQEAWDITIHDATGGNVTGTFSFFL